MHLTRVTVVLESAVLASFYLISLAFGREAACEFELYSLQTPQFSFRICEELVGNWGGSRVLFQHSRDSLVLATLGICIALYSGVNRAKTSPIVRATLAIFAFRFLADCGWTLANFAHMQWIGFITDLIPEALAIVWNVSLLRKTSSTAKGMRGKDRPMRFGGV